MSSHLPVTCLLLGVFLFVSACSRPTATWDRPWDCRQVFTYPPMPPMTADQMADGEQPPPLSDQEMKSQVAEMVKGQAPVDCSEMSDKETLDQWENENEEKVALAYRCAGQDVDWYEDQTRDFICEPIFSQHAGQFADDTAPRFHCFGYEYQADEKKDDDTPVDFHCEPYWELTPKARTRKGAGWNLWLALQMGDPERTRLLASASQISERELKESDRKMKELKPVPCAPGAIVPPYCAK